MGEVPRSAGLAGVITSERPPHRLTRLANWMETEDVDCVVAFGADNVTYLGGYWRYYGGPSALVLDRDGRRTLVVMRDEVPVAERLGEADEVRGFGERGFGIELNPLPILAAAAAEISALANAASVGVADSLGPMSDLLGERLSARLTPVDQQIVAMRLLKDEDELVKIVHAYQLCWLGQRAVNDATQNGASEIQIFSAAQSTAQIAHGEPIEFLADLLSGPDTCEVCCPIRIATDRRVAQGDPVVADVVVGAGGYWGDSAETHLRGSNSEVEEVRAALLDILEQTRRELVPGNTGTEIYRMMAARIAEAVPGAEFPHHGGHAIGLTAFEDPHLIPSDDTPLENWMVIAAEPGAYVKGRFGARVENVFLVTPDGGVELRDAMGVPRA